MSVIQITVEILPKGQRTATAAAGRPIHINLGPGFMIGPCPCVFEYIKSRVIQFAANCTNRILTSSPSEWTRVIRIFWKVL